VHAGSSRTSDPSAVHATSGAPVTLARERSGSLSPTLPSIGFTAAHEQRLRRNLIAEPRVTVRVADRTLEGTARVVSAPAENQTARHLLLRKCEPAYSGDLSNWGRTALAIAVDLQF
jgi:hypothetical protein